MVNIIQTYLCPLFKEQGFKTLENQLATPLEANLRAYALPINLAKIALIVGGGSLFLFGTTTNKEIYSIVGASFVLTGFVYLIDSKIYNIKK